VNVTNGGLKCDLFEKSWLELIPPPEFLISNNTLIGWSVDQSIFTDRRDVDLTVDDFIIDPVHSFRFIILYNQVAEPEP